MKDWITNNWKKNAGIGLAVAMAFAFLTVVSTSFIIGYPQKTFMGITFSDFTFFAFAVLIAPIGEELVFRGALYNFFTNIKKLNWIAFAVINAALFSLFHYVAYGSSITAMSAGFIGAFIFGISMYVLRKYTGGVTAPIVCHAAFNFWLIRGTLFAFGI